MSYPFSILDVLFPKMCFNCRAFGKYICADCQKKLMLIQNAVCPYCEAPSNFGLTHGTCRRLYGLDGLQSVFYYDKVFQNVLKGIKFRHIRGGMNELVNAIPDFFWQRLLQTSAIFFSDAVITPVPLHKKRYRERGFNQADDFARACSIMVQKNYSALVARNRYTQAQSQTASVTDRYINIYKAFDISFSGKRLPQRVVIVDDVWTTGATIREITSLLKHSGVERVYGLTLARRERV